jgi:hypothetical protein
MNNQNNMNQIDFISLDSARVLIVEIINNAVTFSTSPTEDYRAAIDKINNFIAQNTAILLTPQIQSAFKDHILFQAWKRHQEDMLQNPIHAPAAQHANPHQFLGVAPQQLPGYTSENLRPEIFWHLTENRPFSSISPEMAHFLDFSVTPKSRLFRNRSFRKIPEKKVE